MVGQVSSAAIGSADSVDSRYLKVLDDGTLQVAVDSGGGDSVHVDGSSFETGVDGITAVGGVVSSDPVSDGEVAAVGITVDREWKIKLSSLGTLSPDASVTAVDALGADVEILSPTEILGYTNVRVVIQESGGGSGTLTNVRVYVGPTESGPWFSFDSIGTVANGAAETHFWSNNSWRFVYILTDGDDANAAQATVYLLANNG